jgi:hypothetical protein
MPGVMPNGRTTCSCGIVMSPVQWVNGGAPAQSWYCHHCDRVCTLKDKDCRLCTRLKKAV